MTGRIFLANVGANATHPFSSPIFPDGTFELIPIPEDRDLPGGHAVRYRDLTSHYDPSLSLTRYLPQRIWEWPAHHDPEFETFTYGDNCETSPRAASLKRMGSGDLLFFIARLVERASHDASETVRPDTGRGFYLVGYLDIEEILSNVRCRPGVDVLRRFGSNAHVLRGLSDSKLWDHFWVFRGGQRSRRFGRAVPVNRELADRVFVTAAGSPWRWDGGRTDLQIIGSYTRSCRCVIDPALDGHANRAEALWEWVGRHTG